MEEQEGHDGFTTSMRRMERYQLEQDEAMALLYGQDTRTDPVRDYGWMDFTYVDDGNGGTRPLTMEERVRIAGGNAPGLVHEHRREDTAAERLRAYIEQLSSADTGHASVNAATQVPAQPQPLSSRVDALEDELAMLRAGNGGPCVRPTGEDRDVGPGGTLRSQASPAEAGAGGDGVLPRLFRKLFGGWSSGPLPRLDDDDDMFIAAALCGANSD